MRRCAGLGRQRQRRVWAMELSLETLDIVNPERYVSEGYPWAEWEFLRKHAPIFWYDRPNVRPFWAVVKHADIVAISREPELFLSGQRFPFFVVPKGSEEGIKEPPIRTLLQMNPPEHRLYRALTSSHFTPRALARLEAEVFAIARGIIDELCVRARGTPPTVECDFVTDVAAKLPLAVIAAMIGIPPEDRAQVLRWTNEVLGGAHPEYRSAPTPLETSLRAKEESFIYFARLCRERTLRPRDDLISVLVSAQVNGAPLAPFELLSYLHLLVVAGNETTRNATSGGLLALIENRDQWQLLRNDLSLHLARNPVHPHRRTRRRDPRRQDPRRPRPCALLPVGQPRRRRLRPSQPLRYHPQPESPSCLRHRRARLSGGKSRPART